MRLKNCNYIFQPYLRLEKEVLKVKNISKIAIIGGPGTGKTTLADNLGKVLELPVYHIDGIHHLANWKPRDKDERDRIIMEKVGEPKWVIDGTYQSTLENRVKAADLVIFLNYSRMARMKGIFSRYFKRRGKEKPEIPGCKEKIDWEFLKFTFNWNNTKGKIIKDVLERNKDKNVLAFKTRKELNRWYEIEFNRKIEI